MKKRLLVLLILLIFMITGCAGRNADNTDDQQEENVLVIYSAGDEDFLGAIIPLFEEKTGIEVQIQEGGAGEIFKRIEA